jgi:hypothetical protein
MLLLQAVQFGAILGVHQHATHSTLKALPDTTERCHFQNITLVNHISHQIIRSSLINHTRISLELQGASRCSKTAALAT